MNLRLIRPTAAYRRQITEMLDEWFAEEKPEDVTPWAITKNDYHDFAFYISHLDVPEGPPPWFRTPPCFAMTPTPTAAWAR